MMNILLWILFGALVGWVASLIVHTDAEQGSVANIAVGIIGAVLGGFLARLFGVGTVSGFNTSSFIIALLGAILLLGIMRALRRSPG